MRGIFLSNVAVNILARLPAATIECRISPYAPHGDIVYRLPRLEPPSAGTAFAHPRHGSPSPTHVHSLLYRWLLHFGVERAG